MSKYTEAFAEWQKVIDETVTNKNTGVRVGGAGQKTLEAILEIVNPSVLVQISTQEELDAFRPESGLAIVTMGDDIDTDIKAIFGTDNNKIEIHAYTIAGTGTDSVNRYQEGVSAIDGKKYRRLFVAFDGWGDFEINEVTETDLSQKMQYKGDYDAIPYANYLVNDVYSWRGNLYIVKTSFSTTAVSPSEDFHDPDDTNYWTTLTKNINKTVTTVNQLNDTTYVEADNMIVLIDNRTGVFNSMLPSTHNDLSICRMEINKTLGVGGMQFIQNVKDIWGTEWQRYTTWSDDAYEWSFWSQIQPTAHNHLNDTLKPKIVEYQSGATVPTNVGSQYYDDTFKVLSTVLGNNVVLQNGLEMYVRVVNKTGVQLNDGQAVYISGAQGNRPTATLAIATSESASYVIGVCTENITNNQEGFVTVFGTVNGYNTSGFTDGAKLYLSATVAGGLTMTRPVAPNHGVIVGIALNSTNNGAIFVNPNSGFELSELHDVDTTKTKIVPLDADYFLMQDTADSNIWKKVLKANLNEIYVGTGTPSHNEVLIIDNSADLLAFRASTSATIVPNFTLDVDKYTSNYAGGNTVLIDFPTFDTEKNVTWDNPDKYLALLNTKASDITFVLSTGTNVFNGIAYTYKVKNGDNFVLSQNKSAEVSYFYLMTSATTCDVWILWNKES